MSGLNPRVPGVAGDGEGGGTRNQLGGPGVHSIVRLFGKLLAVLAPLVASASHASACSCGGVNGRTPWEVAEKEFKGSTAVFEGTPEKTAVEWNILSAGPGSMVRVFRDQPRMIITLRVEKVYKGDLGRQVQVRTGMWGGDCGAGFATGLDYLVYASGQTSRDLRVSICSPGGLLESAHIATELRYLQHQRPLANDLEPVLHGSELAARERTEQEELMRRIAPVTGQICGFIDPAPAIDRERAVVAFLSTTGFSPYWRAEPEVGRDGKFCSGRLGPGEYYLYFTRWAPGRKEGSALYYPGVVDRSKATLVHIDAGEVRANLIFRVSQQETHTIRGFLSTDDKSGLGEDGAHAMLIDADGRIWDRQAVDFRSAFPLPRVKYFAFDDVPAGRYIAYAVASGSGWSTKVVHVDVTNHSKLISLELKHSNTGGK